MKYLLTILSICTTNTLLCQKSDYVSYDRYVVTEDLIRCGTSITTPHVYVFDLLPYNITLYSNECEIKEVSNQEGVMFLGNDTGLCTKPTYFTPFSTAMPNVLTQGGSKEVMTNDLWIITTAQHEKVRKRAQPCYQ